MNDAELTFSLVINTTDRAASLRTLLYALEQQSYPHFEVVVVVGPTHDNTLEMLQEFGERVRVRCCARANLSQSRNIGLLAASGDVVAFIDDDAVPSRTWLAQLATLFRDPALDATGGSVYSIHPSQPALQHRIGIVSSLAEQVDVRLSRLDEIVPDGMGHQWVARMMGTNMAFRRRALLAVQGFDEFYEWVYDDTDLALRLLNAGKIVHPVQEAVVYHVPASSRNRVAYTFVGRWWIQTKAAVYFCIKNGSAVGERWQDIALRSLHLTHGHWLWIGQLRREGRISFRQMVYMRGQEIRSALHGAQAGLLGKRKLIEAGKAAEHLKQVEPIRRFPEAGGSTFASVDPISGELPQITMPDTPLRICLMSQAYPPDQFEGVGRHTNLMARGLHTLGHTVHVVALGEREQVTHYDGAYVHRISYRLERYRSYRHLPRLCHLLNYSHAAHDKVKRLILNDDIQLVDSPVWQADGLITAQADLLPVVVRPQTALRQIAALQRESDDDVRLVGNMEQVLINHAAFLVPNSRATAETLTRVYDVDPQSLRLAVVPHGIVPVADEEFCLRDPHHAPATPIVLYVGRLEKRKGILDLFGAIPRVLARYPQVRFVLAGRDNSRSDLFFQRAGSNYADYFARSHPELADRVQFLGEVDDATLQALYRDCDLFVAPSLYESFGLIYLEAMNYGKAVIGCQVGGIPEVVDQGVTGLLVEPAAPAALAEAMLELLQSPRRLHDMGMAGRRRLLERFTHVQMAKGFEAIYRQVVQARQQANLQSGSQVHEI